MTGSMRRCGQASRAVRSPIPPFRAPETGKSSRFVAEYLLNEAGVAGLSGTAFGAFGEGYLRFSYANSVENIQIALERIRKAFANM